MKVFLSYTRSKDQFLAVSSFRQYFAAELAIRSPGSTIFQDKERIEEGDHFPEVLENEIHAADVLLVLLSPAWLQSVWCRREFTLFTKDLGDHRRLHQILPVLWVDTPQVHPLADDPIAKTLAPIQSADWRHIRYGPWESPVNQRQVGELSQRALSLVTRSARHVVSGPPVHPQELSRPADSPAILQRIKMLMPELLEEMRTDLATQPLKREFVVLERNWVYWPNGNELIYYYDDHTDLDDKVRILENEGLIREITSNNTKRYLLSEQFAKHLGAP